MIGLSTRVVISMALVVGAVGAFDAFISREWDLLAVFALMLTLNVWVWLRMRATRVPVSLRPDLARWLEQQSNRTGEPFDDLLDRAIAWYRHGLFVDDRNDGG